MSAIVEKMKKSGITIPQCNRCKHMNTETLVNCAAFPETRIPDDIDDNSFIHNRIHPEQANEVVFEAIPESVPAQ